MLYVAFTTLELEPGERERLFKALDVQECGVGANGSTCLVPENVSDAWRRRATCEDGETLMIRLPPPAQDLAQVVTFWMILPQQGAPGTGRTRARDRSAGGRARDVPVPATPRWSWAGPSGSPPGSSA